ncbi:MAG: phosphoribosylanthranilate isomerase [Pseudomonadales bacterium]|nr:phosphoribosylanthranilate isomerase [Pseudomonadales bacterium]
MRTRIKICGITNIDDANAAIDAGVDALGFVMYAKSPRYITVEAAMELVEKIPPFVTTVALFVNESSEFVNRVLDQVSFDLCQFHGDESDQYCRQFKKPFLKAIRVKKDMSLQQVVDEYPSSHGVLLDTYVPGNYGGTGESIDWQALPTLRNKVVLAGGLEPNNVAAAISLVNPYGIDVSSGVEAQQGRKDINKIRDFVNAVAAADRGS